MITPEEIEETLQECLPYMQQFYKVQEIGYFGSFATNKAHSCSDLDVLVTFTEAVSWQYYYLIEYLEYQLELRIELTDITDIPYLDREHVLSETKFISPPVPG